LYYFGARYYDARTSVWVSPDPILDKYLPTGKKDEQLPGMGGVFNGVNLNPYNYAGQNPVMIFDPNGELLVKVKLSQFNKAITVDKTFLPYLSKMNSLARERGIKIIVTSSFRKDGAAIKNAVYTPAKRSNHKVGRAIDVNLIDNDGSYYGSKRLTNSKMSENIKGFIADLKEEGIRWGGTFSDPVHFDTRTTESEWNKLFNEDQNQQNITKVSSTTSSDRGEVVVIGIGGGEMKPRPTYLNVSPIEIPPFRVPE